MSRRNFAKQQRTRRRSNPPVLIAGLGQSNMARYFDNDGAGNQGEQAVNSVMQAFNPQNTFINGATGGSAAHVDADNGSGYWYDPDTDTFGGAWDNFIDALDGRTPDVVFWSQGETDIFYLNNGTITGQQYEDALFGIFAKINELYPDCLILIQRIGRFGNETSSFDTEYNDVRNAQDLAEETLDYVYFGAESYDLEMQDTYHLTDYTVIATRMANRAAALLGYRSEVGTLGVRIASIEASNGSTTITVTLDHDAGDDIDKTGSFSNQGWRILINGANRTGSANVTKVDENTLQLTSTVAPSGSQVVAVDYVINSQKGQTIGLLSDYISDNANPVMPLQGVRGFEAIKV